MIIANLVLPSPRCSQIPGSDREKFQFALNLHIYKAEVFLRSSVGCGINDISPGLVKGPAPIGATLADLDKRTRKFYEESGLASIGHIRANSAVPPYTPTVAYFTGLTAEMTYQLGGCGVKDEPLIVPLPLGAEKRTTTNVIAADANSLVYARTEREFLRILFRTGNATRPGGLFPCGFEGKLYHRILALKLS
ncbi:hypothetical protein V6N12_001919 [Hibiscus sabdariffa]